MELTSTELWQVPDRDLLHRVLGEGALRVTSLAKAFGLQLSDETGDTQGQGEPLLLCVRELLARAMAESIRGQPVFDQPQAAMEFLRLKLGGISQESFWVLYLDSQHRLICAEEMFRGTLTQTSVYPREVVKSALRRNAAAVILAHNHPSGIARPSRADEALTQSLKASLSLVDVRVLDHFIVGDTVCTSMATMGLV